MARPFLNSRNGENLYCSFLGELTEEVMRVDASIVRATSKLYFDLTTHQWKTAGSNVATYLPHFNNALSVEKGHTNLFLNNQFSDSPVTGLTAEDSGVVVSRTDVWSVLDGCNYSAEIVCGEADKIVYQEISLEAGEYFLQGYAKLPSAGVVDSSVLSLYAATDLVSSVLSTTFRSLGGGVYEFWAKFTATEDDYCIGAKIKTGKTVYLHMFDLYETIASCNFPSAPIPTEGDAVIVNFDNVTIADSITPDVWNKTEGSICFWMLPYFDGKVFSGDPNIVEWVQVGVAGADYVNMSSWSQGCRLGATFLGNVTGIGVEYEHVAGVWQHHCLSWVGGHYYYYIDGVLILDGQVGNVISTIPSPAKIQIGASGYVFYRHCGCAVCNFGVWNRKLSVSELDILIAWGQEFMPITKQLLPVVRTIIER